MSQENSKGGEDHALLEILISERKGRKDQVTKQEASFQKVASFRKMWSSLTKQEMTCVTLTVDRLHQGDISVERTFGRRGSHAGRNRAGTVGETKGCISDENGAV